MTARSARVVTALQRLNGDATQIDLHVDPICFTMLGVLASRRAHGHDIGVKDGEAFALARPKSIGPAIEFRDLRRACRKAIAGKITPQQWCQIWAAMPERIKVLWKLLLIERRQLDEQRNGDWIRRGLHRTIDRSTLAMGFETDDYGMIAPKPEIVLPMIEAAIENMPRRQARTRSPEEAAAVAVIRNAYAAITGHKGGRALSEDGKLKGRLHALRLEIGLIFGTDLFDVKDSKRFR